MRALSVVVETSCRIDVFVNALGRYEVPHVRFWEIDGQTGRTVLDNNLSATSLCCRAVGSEMLNVHSTRVVNGSSNAVVFAIAYCLHHIAERASIAGRRGLCLRVGPDDLAVNAFSSAPAPTDQSLGAGGEDYLQEVVASQWLQIPIKADDVLQAGGSLAGLRARVVNGQTVFVNGGASVRPFEGSQRGGVG